MVASPQKTKKDLLDYLKKYPDQPELKLLFGICIYECEKKEPIDRKLKSLKTSLEYIASAITGDVFSVMYSSTFFVIYFDYIINSLRFFRQKKKLEGDDSSFNSDIKDAVKILTHLDAPRSSALKRFDWCKGAFQKVISKFDF